MSSSKVEVRMSEVSPYERRELCDLIRIAERKALDAFHAHDVKTEVAKTVLIHHACHVRAAVSGALLPDDWMRDEILEACDVISSAPTRMEDIPAATDAFAKAKAVSAWASTMSLFHERVYVDVPGHPEAVSIDLDRDIEDENPPVRIHLRSGECWYHNISEALQELADNAAGDGKMEKASTLAKLARIHTLYQSHRPWPMYWEKG